MRLLALRALALAALARELATALDNGFVLPGLYWSTWNHFGGGIGDALLRECADAMVSSGLRDAGYRGINLDDGASSLCATRAFAACPRRLSPSQLTVPAVRSAAARAASSAQAGPSTAARTARSTRTLLSSRTA
jgi:hypothetical protein